MALIQTNFAYQEEKSPNDRDKISDKFSEISNVIFQQIHNNVTSKKPIFLAFPKGEINTLPLISLEYSKLTNKDVLVVSPKSYKKEHLKQYELLSRDDGQYEFMFTIPIIIERQGARIRLNNGRIGPRQKFEQSAYMLDLANMLNKIVFCDYNFIMESMEDTMHTFFEDINKSTDLNLKLGTIIFEKIDNILSNYNYRRIFLKWIKLLSEKGLNIFLHTSLVYSNIIDQIQKEIDMEIINVNHYLLRDLQLTSEPNRYELTTNICENQEIKIIGNIELLNIDKIEDDILEISKLLRGSKIPIQYKKVFSLLWILRNMIMHPSLYKFIMVNVENEYIYGTVDNYIQIINHHLKKEEGDFKFYLQRLFNAVYSYYVTLKNTYRYGEEHHFTAKSKNSFLLDYLHQLDKENKKEQLGIVYFNKFEGPRLNNQLQNQKFENIKYSLIHYEEAIITPQNFDETIVPGSLKNHGMFTQLVNNFSDVKILSYKGSDHDHIEEMLSNINEMYWYNRSISSFENLTKEKNEHAKNIVSKHPAKKEKKKTKAEEEINYIDLIELNFDFDDTKTTNETDYTYTGSVSDNSIVLLNTKTNQTIEIGIGKFSNFLKLNEDGSYENVITTELSESDTIIRFGDSEGNIFDLMREIYNFDEQVDFDIIQIWKNSFQRGLEKIEETINEADPGHKVTITDLFGYYKEVCKDINHKPKQYVTFLGYVKDKRIGPEDEKDVLALGLIGNFPNIKSEYKYIHQQMANIRRLHILIGHQLTKILRNILNKQMVGNPSLQEQLLFEKIGFYKVIKINILN